MRENHSDQEVIRAVTTAELKSILLPHLGDTELFQALMNAKPLEEEMPKPFLYKKNGAQTKGDFYIETDSDVRNKPQTAQNVFLRTISQEFE